LKIRIGGIALFILIGLLSGILQPFAPSLGPQGHLALMAILFAIGFWIFGAGWLPLSIGSVIMLLVLLVAGLGYSVVFSGYTSRAIWILIPALFFGFALTATGLGKRLAYGVIHLFKPSYLTLTVSWVIIGVLLSILTPSITVRVAIVIPIAAAMVEICNIQYGSRGAGFIMLTAWAMVIIPGLGWVTGSLTGPIAIGFFAATPGLEDVITFNSWMKAFLMPALLLAILFVLGLYRFMKPSERISIKPDAFKAEYRALGSMSFQEKATLGILSLTFILLVTGQFTGIPDVAVCLGAFVLLALFGVIKGKDIGSAISWDLILFLGAIMGLGLVFQQTGISVFLSNAFTPELLIVSFQSRRYFSA